MQALSGSAKQRDDVCEKTGRICRCIELDALYVDVIIRRYQKVTGEEATFEETGEGFEALTKRRDGEC